MFITGNVVAVDEENALVRVSFPERENCISWELTVNQPRSGVYWMPRLGEQVNCLMDDQLRRGTVIGSFYTKESPPPVQTGEKCHISFPDGTVIDYDLSSRHLTADIGSGTVNIKASKITLDGDVEITQNLTVSGKASVSGNIEGAAEVKDIKGSMNDLRHVYNTHTHLCSLPELPSKPPVQPM